MINPKSRPNNQNAKKEQVKSCSLRLVCLPQEKSDWQKKAEQLGISLSEYIRQRLNNVI